MELELQYTELSCCEAGESVTLTQEEALEAAIPEYCPEVTRIVDAVGQLCLREYTSRQISGSVLVTVLYTSEESPGLRSLTLPVPFLTQADDKRLTGCDTVCMAGRLLLTEARAVTGRKLYLRVMPELTLTGYTCRRHRICTGVGEEPTLRLHRQEQSLTLLTSVTQRQSSVTQELQPQDWGEPPEELLAQRICPRITGSQPVGSRLLAKGEARICLLYRTQDGSLHTWEDTLPFSCLLDGLTVPEEAQVTVTGSCGTARLIRSDGAAAIGVELTLSLLVRTYETVTVAPVTDLYSTRWDTALQRQSLTLTETWPPETVQPEVHQELESRPIQTTAMDSDEVDRLVAQRMEEELARQTPRRQEEQEQAARDAYDAFILTARSLDNLWKALKPQISRLAPEQKIGAENLLLQKLMEVKEELIHACEDHQP